MIIKINNHNTGYIPERHGAMYDLALAEDVTINKGDHKLLSLGISMELPKGYFAKLYPRSSTFNNWHITMANSVGIIDNNYCGDDDIWKFPAIAHETIHIPKGTRIAQFEICKEQEEYEFLNVPKLGNDSRGGFGSTGN